MTPGAVFTIFHFFITYLWANKLECYITLGSKGLSGKNTPAYWAHL
jgi:hypothetical protein